MSSVRALVCAVTMATLVVGTHVQAQARTGDRAGNPAVSRGALRADTVWSQSLGIRKRLVVYLPPSYATDTARRYPVAFYLHGLGGNEDNWLQLARIDQVADSLFATGASEAIVIMPDGDDSWYSTWATLPAGAACAADTVRKEPAATYCVPWPHYDDYIARDLVAHVDSNYRTLRSPRHRGIGGLSMGGYGALTLALRYPDVFGAAASHSGVLAPALLGPRPFREPAVWARTPDELKMAAGARYGWFAHVFGRDTIGWYARDPGRLAERLVTVGTPVPSLFVDVGVGDVFLDQNRAFAATLRGLGVSYEYAEHTGGHDWTYWRTHLPTSLHWLLHRIAGDPPEPA